MCCLVLVVCRWLSFADSLFTGLCRPVFVVSCVLFVVCLLQVVFLVDCLWLFVVRCSLFVFGCWAFVVACWLSMFVGRCSLVVGCVFWSLL